MFNRKKHKKTIKELEKENAEMKLLVSKLEGQLKSELEALQQTTGILNALKEKGDLNNKLRKEYLAQLNHKLRSPMNEIIGMSNLLSDSSLGDEQKQFLSYINSAGKNLLNMLNDILFFFKSEYGGLEMNYQELSIKLMLEELHNGFKQKLKYSENIDLYLRLDNNIPEILSGDKDKLYIILFNLLRFTISYIKKGLIVTQVRVLQKNCKETKIRFRINYSTEENKPEKLENVFMPFSVPDMLLSNSDVISGVELAIAKSLVNLMGGEIEFDSDKNNGSNFIFTLTFRNLKK